MKSSVDVTHLNAVYVNSHRITHRGTKWGLHRIIDTFECNDEEVFEELMKRGHEKHARNIDCTGYGK